MPDCRYAISLSLILLFLVSSSCTDKNRFIVLNNTLPDTSVSVLKESLDGDEAFKAIIPPGDSLKVFKFQYGEKFYFRAAGVDDYEVLPFVIDSVKQQTYNIVLKQKIYKEVTQRYKQLANISSSQYGIDILKLNPFDQFNGRTQAIFKTLDTKDRDWQRIQDAYALKSHFTLSPIKAPLIRQSPIHELSTSSAKYQELFASTIEVDSIYKSAVGNYSAAQISNSLGGYPRYLYSWYKEQRARFSVAVNPLANSLEPAFISSLKALPLITTFPDSTATPYTINSFKPYFDFIKRWGTHYPSKIIYGDGLIASNKLRADEVIPLLINDIPIQNAVASKIKRRVKRSMDSLNVTAKLEDSILKNSQMLLLQKQLASAAELSDPNAYPIGYQLSPLYSLTERVLSKEEDSLPTIKKALRLATEAYVTGVAKQNTNLNVVGLKLNCYDLYLGTSRDATKPMNTISQAHISMQLKKPEALADEIWERAVHYKKEWQPVYSLTENDEMVSLPLKTEWNKGFSLREISMYINLDEIPENFLAEVAFVFSATFNEKDGTTGKYDDTIAGETTVLLKDILQQQGSSISLWCYDLNKERENGDLEINLNFDIEMLPLY